MRPHRLSPALLVLLPALALPAAGWAQAPAACVPEASVGGMVSAMAREDLAHAVGEWSEYALLRQGRANYAETIRFLIVGDVDPAGAPWFELWMGKTGQSAIRFRGPSEGAPMEVFVKLGSAIFSVDDPETRDKLVGGAGACRPGGGRVVARPARVKTLAGTFDCRHVVQRTPQGKFQVWYSDEIPALKLAKLVDPLGSGFELVAAGRDAVSAFPRRFQARPLPLKDLTALRALSPKIPGAGAADPEAAAPPGATAPAPAPGAAPAPAPSPADAGGPEG